MSATQPISSTLSGLTPLVATRQRGAAVYRAGFCIGGVSVSLSSTRSEDVTLTSALEPFRFSTERSDISIRVNWVSCLTRARARKAFDSGTTWRLHDTGEGFHFDFFSPSLGDQPYRRLFVNKIFNRATLQMNEESFARDTGEPDPLEYPLDELLIMHRLTQEQAIELHGSGIVRGDGVGNLFVGHSGAGKSTTTRLWTAREEVEILSDDRIIVRQNAEYDGSPSSSPMRMYGTPWHGEAMFASPNSAPLSRIFILEHGYGNVITPLSRSQAVAELFARAFVPFHRHEYVDSALSFLERVADSIPCYRYSFEPDERAVARIADFRD